jgi:hypothetical protein
VRQKGRRDDDDEEVGDRVPISTNSLVVENESELNHNQARNLAVA